MDTQFLSSEEELNQDSIVIGGLDPEFTYDFRVVAVDGDHETPSETIPVYTYSTLPPSGASGTQPVATSGKLYINNRNLVRTKSQGGQRLQIFQNFSLQIRKFTFYCIFIL